MAAIEYGSYYWCVVLKETAPGMPAKTIHLHADGLVVDPTGALTFTSRGRRPAGMEPEEARAPDGPSSADGADRKNQEPGSVAYFAIAPGSWKLVYAAKLQDGSPASVEHWNAREGNAGAAMPIDAGAWPKE
ncbi:MAG: hypothetical protein ACRD40_05230 [Candidatus Acidiferrales bacterium]